MRDIRSDLEERALQEQMRAAYAHFERMAQQLQSERDARVSGLKEMLAMIDKLIPIRDRHRGQSGDAGECPGVATFAR
jgi:hypothetical protein